MKVEIQCLCGAVKVAIDGEPIAQFYCHCDDCQAVSGGAYVAVAVFPSRAAQVVQGEPATWVYKTLRRKKCAACGTQLMAEVPGTDLIGVKANLLPEEMFKPEFHINCQYAVLPVRDNLPHFKSFPAKFGGSDETVGW